jgi:hypothetical protein
MPSGRRRAALGRRDPGRPGPGGCGAQLLERLAQALGLAYRFYNASLINYHDLVGIPLPDETQSSLRYITTPTAIWDAEVVFVDELNRTRPDLQNKLFPIIHERRVQGVELEKLLYRWAAMNPPRMATTTTKSSISGRSCHSDLGDFSPDSMARAMREACMPSEVVPVLTFLVIAYHLLITYAIWV